MTNQTTLDTPATYENCPAPVITQSEAKSDSQDIGNQQGATGIIPVAPRAASGSEISAVESAQLTELEAIVDEGRKTFLKVGSALLEIQEGRLYRSSHGTFDAYCQERFGFQRRNAYRLIDAAKVVGNLESVSHGTQIETERQAREVGKAPVDKQAEVVQRATELADHRGSKLTASIISEARDLVCRDGGDDSFRADIETLEVGQGWVQFLDEQSDSTLIARVDSGYRVFRIIGKEIIKGRARDVEGVLASLDSTDSEYDMLTGMESYEFLEDTTDMLEDLERVWLGIAGCVPA